MHLLGLVHHAIDNRDEALEALQEELRIRETLFAKYAPIFGETCYELSDIHAERQDEYSLVLNYAHRALNIIQNKCPSTDTKLHRAIELVQRLSKQMIN